MRFVNRNNACKKASTLFLWHRRRKEKALQKESAVWGIAASAEGDQRLCLWQPQAFEKA